MPRFNLLPNLIIIASRTLLTFVNSVAKCDLRYNFTARMPFPAENGLLQLLIALIKDLLPIAVMLLNIRTINFKVYLIELIKASDQSDETSSANEDQYKSNYEQISRIDRYQSAMMTTRSMGPHLENSL